MASLLRVLLTTILTLTLLPLAGATGVAPLLNPALAPPPSPGPPPPPPPTPVPGIVVPPDTRGSVGIPYRLALTFGQIWPARAKAAAPWRITQGQLPEGLNLSRKTGVISGTPTRAQTSTIEVGYGPDTPQFKARITIVIDAEDFPGAFRSLAGGGNSVCAINTQNNLYCWGSGQHGMLGNGDDQRRRWPARVTNLSDVTQVAMGPHATCAVDGDGRAWCWGSRVTPWVGTTTARPAQVPLPHSVSRVTTGLGFACALLKDETVWCWGMTKPGESSSPEHIVRPYQVVGLPLGVKTVEAGYEHVCVAGAFDGVWCWGANPNSALGRPAGEPSGQPARVDGFTGRVLRLSTHFQHTCLIDTEHQLWCWGDNLSKQISATAEGVVTRATLVPTPDVVPSAVEVGVTHTCLVTATGQVRCWGQHITGIPNLPSVINGWDRDMVEVGTAVYSVCALHRTGQASCFGYGGEGTLGNIVATNSDTPVPVVQWRGTAQNE